MQRNEACFLVGDLQVETTTLKWTRKGEVIIAFLRITKSLVENY